MLAGRGGPNEFRENVRNMLRIMVQQARYAVGAAGMPVNGGVAACLGIRQTSCE